MMSRTSIRTLPLIAMFAMAASVRSQTPSQPPAPCSPSSQQKSNSPDSKPAPDSKTQTDSDPCASSGKEPPAADRFPFPGESQPAKPQPQNTPDAPAPSGGKPPNAADKFPFPSSAPPMPGSEPDSSGGSSSSSSSSGSSSADDPGNTPSADKPPTGDKSAPPKNARRRLPKIEKLQSDEERAAEDLKVSKFYEDSGKLNAAYLRAQDAVKYQPSDPETHFALARVAQKLEKKEEAATEYNTYLQLAPDGLRIKQAQKALSQLQR